MSTETPSDAKDLILVCPNCAGLNRVAAGRDPRAAKCGRCQTMLFSGTSWPATAKTFSPQVTRSDIPVVVDFWADWCGPCKAMAPYFERVCAELEPKARFLKLDTEAEQAIAAKFSIRAIPTTMVFSKGKVLAQRAGAMDQRTLSAWLQPILDQARAAG
ncbi:MAG: thioredoxin TrxC [Devosia sp.]|nr:thioredoxin TrxC [Devosia sp.]